MSGSERRCDDAAAVLENWRPRGWSGEDLGALVPLMPTVRALVAAAEPVDGHDARRLLRAVAKLVIWGSRTLGTTDPVVLLADSNIEYFTMEVNGTESPHWRHDTRGVLRRVSRAAAPELWPPPPMTIGRSRGVRTYTPRDEEAFRLDAAQPGWTNRGARLFVCAALLGAGMRGIEAAAACTWHVEEVGDGRLAIRVGGKRPRRAPVRGAYTGLLRAAVAETGHGKFIASSAEGAAGSIAADIRCGEGSLKLRRARVTWIQAQMEAGISLRALYVIAGDVSEKTINDLTKSCAAEMDPDTALVEGLRA